ncbi:hypothetical protein M8J77_017626 [Diaphorina citri]|nr:hypothetical protein M8J77_017626 [Diaphorina citri]
MDKVTYLGMQQHMAHLQHQQHMNKGLSHYIPTLKVPQVLSSNGQHLLDNPLGFDDFFSCTQFGVRRQKQDLLQGIAPGLQDQISVARS